MSKNKSKKIAGRARKEAREEQQAKNVIMGIATTLIVLFLIISVVFYMMQA